MENKVDLIIERKNVHPLTRETYSFQVKVGELTQTIPVDEMNRIVASGRMNIIDNSIVFEEVPDGGSYLQKKFSASEDFMSILLGDELLGDIETIPSSVKGKRELFNTLISDLLDEDDSSVILLHGLRRTGKTILLKQLLSELVSKYSINKNETCLITINNPKVTTRDLFRSIKEIVSKVDAKYIFIDEVTMISDILESLQYIHDMYGIKGVKFILTGTNSYVINLLKNRSLATRCKYRILPEVSYREHCNLIEDISVMDYMRIGGIFTKDFKDELTRDTYIYTAIAQNIAGSLVLNNISSTLQGSKINIEALVTRILYNSMYKTTSQLVEKEFNLRFVSGERLENELIKSLIDYIDTIIKVNLGNDINPDRLSEVLKILIEIGVLGEVKLISSDEVGYHVTRYPGLIYSICNNIARSAILIERYEGVTLEAKEIDNRYRSALEGSILEGIVASELLSLDKNKVNHIGTLNMGNKAEIDLVVINRDMITYLIEVKRTSSRNSKQVRWLVDKGVNKRFEASSSKINRIVVYNGIKGKVKVTKEIKKMKELDNDTILQEHGTKHQYKGGYCEDVDAVYYINVDEFLKYKEEFLFSNRLNSIGEIEEGGNSAKLSWN